MPLSSIYGSLADFVVLVHFAYAAFIVLSVPVIWIGYFLRASFVRNVYFRVGHMVCMLIVLIQTLAGIECPLTLLEWRLRFLAGGGTYKGSFIQYWIHKLLFHEIPPGAFVLPYAVFFGLVLLSILVVRPEFRRSRKIGPARAGSPEDPQFGENR